MDRQSFKRVLITGSNGMLGKDIGSSLLVQDNLEVFGVNRTEDVNLDKDHSILCDITNFVELTNILEYVNPDIIIHCAANVNVDGCEKDKEYAYKLNTESTRVLSAYNSTNTKFIYISTDSVFDGETGNYREEDETNPLNYYAWSKLEGERLALKENSNSMVLRANIYGFHKPEGNSLVEWALKNLKENKKILGFDDVYFNPVYTNQLAKIITELLNINFNGIIHTGCENIVSKYEFLTRLAQKFNMDTNFISKSSIDSITFNAKRPKNTNLNIDKLLNLAKFSVTLEDGFTELIRDYNR